MAPSEETSSSGGTEGTSQSHSDTTASQDADNLPKQEEDEEEVRQKCLFLLNELVSRTEEASRCRQPHVEGGPVQCRLPLTKVSLALQAYVNRASTTHSPNVFQGQKTTSLPNASDESCDAITPFTPSSTKLPGSPSIASATPSSACPPDKSQDTSTAKVVRAPQLFLFQAESTHQVVGDDGQKWYMCDICQTKFHHCFKLKRHYLRNHINHQYLTERDILQCSIIVSDLLPQLNKKDSDVGFPSLYCCHHCTVFFDGKEDLVEHLSVHPEDLKYSSESSDEQNAELPASGFKTVEQNIAPILESFSPDSSPSHTSKLSHSSKIVHDMPEFSKPSSPGSSQRPASQLVCLYCDKSFSTLTLHKRHVHRSHPQQSNAHLSSSQEKNSHHKCTFCTTCTAQEDVTSQDEVKSSDPLKYTCSICRKVFDDYVAMCRHHRKVHKGKRSMSSIFGTVRSPSTGSDSRSQSPALDVCKKSLDNVDPTPAVEDTLCSDTVSKSGNLLHSSQNICDESNKSSQKSISNSICLLYEASDSPQKTGDSLDNIYSSSHKTDVDSSHLSQNVSDSLGSMCDSVHDKRTSDTDRHSHQNVISNLDNLSEKSASDLSSTLPKEVSDSSHEINDLGHNSQNVLNDSCSMSQKMNDSIITVNDSSGMLHISISDAIQKTVDMPQATESDLSKKTNASENINCLLQKKPSALVDNSTVEEVTNLPEERDASIVKNIDDLMQNITDSMKEKGGDSIDPTKKSGNSVLQTQDRDDCVDRATGEVTDVEKKEISEDVTEVSKVPNAEVSKSEKKSSISTIDEVLESVVRKYSVDCETEEVDRIKLSSNCIKKTARSTIDDTLDSVIKNCSMAEVTNEEKKNSIDEILDFVVNNYDSKFDSTSVPDKKSNRSSIDETLDYVVKNFKPSFSKSMKFQSKRFKLPLKKNLKIEPSLTISKKLVKRGRKTLLGEQKINHKLKRKNVIVPLEKKPLGVEDASSTELDDRLNFTDTTSKPVKKIQRSNTKITEKETVTKSYKIKHKNNTKKSGKIKTENATVEGKCSETVIKELKTNEIEICKSDKKNHKINKMPVGKTSKINMKDKRNKILLEKVKIVVKEKINQIHSVGVADGTQVNVIGKSKRKIGKKNHKLSESENELKKSKLVSMKWKPMELELETELSNLPVTEEIHSVKYNLLDESQEKSTNNEIVETKSKPVEAGRVLRSSLTCPTKSSDSAETSETQDHRGRSLRSSSAPGTDADCNRAVRKKPPKGEEITVLKNETLSDSDATKQRVTRGARLRKFSRRVKGDAVQENQHLDPETLFYCRIAGNIRENLLHHLDGKLEVEEAISSDRQKEPKLVPAANCNPTQGDKHHHHHNHHRIPWEKFNFPKNYDGRCKEGMVCLASYIKDMSHLDISTQLTMRQNFQRLSTAPQNCSPKETSVVMAKDDVVGFSKGLCLNAKVSIQQPRRRSLRTAASRGREVTSAMLGGAASTFTASAAMRRWSSADNVAGALVELSGEWVRPRSYICAACGLLFTDLWDLEDHKYSQHPNVWCTHYEFEQAALEQSSDHSRLSVQDLCRRFLLVRDVVDSVPVPSLSSELKCTKCERGFSSLPDLHRHILECGGDTTWMLLPSPSSSGRRSRKWRPFGSRRRRQQGSHRRGMKRNIPNTPVKQYYRNNKLRTVGGDSDSIQRMLANLPAKRATRRVIQFSEDEIKTRSQGTIHSVTLTSGVVQSPHRVSQKSDAGDQNKKLSRSIKKLVRGQIAVKKVVRSKSAPSARDEEEKERRRGRSESPVINKQEVSPPTVDVSEEAKQPVVHKSRSRKKPVSEVAKVEMDEFDVDISNVGSAETSDILAAMRIAMLEGVITEKPPTKKRKPGEPVTLKKKAKTGQSNLEEQFLRNKGYTHPDEVSDEPIICKGCGMQFDNGSAEVRHRKTCIYLPTGEEIADSTTKKKTKLIPAGKLKKQELRDASDVNNKVELTASKKEQVSARSVSASPVRNRKKKQDRKEQLNEKKRSSSLGAFEDNKKKRVVKRKCVLKQKEANALSPATSDIYDRMPELQKEEPLDDLKTQLPSPKLGEDLCDIPILSPVGCEHLTDELEEKQAKHVKNDKHDADDLGKRITEEQNQDEGCRKVTRTTKKRGKEVNDPEVERDTDSDDDIPLVQKLALLKQPCSNDNISKVPRQKRSPRNEVQVEKVAHHRESTSDDDVPLLEKVGCRRKSLSENNIPQVEKEKCSILACSNVDDSQIQKITLHKESSNDDDDPLLEKVRSDKKSCSEDDIPLVEKIARRKESSSDDDVPLARKVVSRKGSFSDDNICVIDKVTSGKQSAGEDPVSSVEKIACLKESSSTGDVPLVSEMSCSKEPTSNTSDTPLVQKIVYHKECSSDSNVSLIEKVVQRKEPSNEDNCPLIHEDSTSDIAVPLVENLVHLKQLNSENEILHSCSKPSSKCPTDVKYNERKLSSKEICTTVTSDTPKEDKNISESTIHADEYVNKVEEREVSEMEEKSMKQITEIDNIALQMEASPMLSKSRHSMSLKKQKRKVVRRRNSIPSWDRKRKSVSKVQFPCVEESVSKLKDSIVVEDESKIQDPAVVEVINKIHDHVVEEPVSKVKDPVIFQNGSKIQDSIIQEISKIQDTIVQEISRMQDPIVKETVSMIENSLIYEEDSNDDLLPISKLKEVIQKKTSSSEDDLKNEVDPQIENVNDSKFEPNVSQSQLHTASEILVKTNSQPENNLEIPQDELFNNRNVLQPVQNKKRSRRNALPSEQLDIFPSEQNSRRLQQNVLPIGKVEQNIDNLQIEQSRRRVRRSAIQTEENDLHAEQTRRCGRSRGNLFAEAVLENNVQPNQNSKQDIEDMAKGSVEISTQSEIYQVQDLVGNVDLGENQLPDEELMNDSMKNCSQSGESKTEEVEELVNKVLEKDQLQDEEIIENFLKNNLNSDQSCLEIEGLVENLGNEFNPSENLVDEDERPEPIRNESLQEICIGVSRENNLKIYEKESEYVSGKKKKKKRRKENCRQVECLTITKKKGFRHVIRKHNRKRNLIDTNHLIDQEHIVMPCSILDSEGEQLITSFVESNSKCDFPGDSDQLMSVAEDTNISVCEETSNLIGGEENITDVLSAVIGGEASGERDGIQLLMEKEKEICHIGKVETPAQEEPLRQARRTRCNTSYEELYTWSDVTTETEDSSQDLPDASIMAALCQEGEATYEELAAMLASGEHLFPSVYRRKKRKKKLRNNSRQYRNGQLRRRRRKKQKLKAKLLKKSKRVNEFIVTDIETGQEESQDSCESVTVQIQPNGSEVPKSARKKKTVPVDEEIKKRKALYCDVCDKHYSTNYNLMKHKQSLTHKKLFEQQNADDASSVLENVENVSSSFLNDGGIPTVLQPTNEVSSVYEDVETSVNNIKESSVLQNIENSLILQNIESTSSVIENNNHTTPIVVEENKTVNENDREVSRDGLDVGKERDTSVLESSSITSVHQNIEDTSIQNQQLPLHSNEQLRSGIENSEVTSVEHTVTDRSCVTVSAENNTVTQNIETKTPSQSLNVENTFIPLEGSTGSEFNQNAVQWTDWSQQNWSSEQENGNQWLYGNQWNWGRDMGWNADSSQDDGTFFQSSNASLGSILDSVNQILDNERSGDGLASGNEYQPYMELLQPESCEDGSGGLRELQQAMGATDEEMAMLQQLGEGNWPLEDADIMDLDSQKSVTNLAQEVVSSSATTTNEVEPKQNMASTSSTTTLENRVLVGRGGLRNQDILLSRYESKDMVCPVCSRRFLGLSALRAHLSAAHNSSTRHRTQNDFNKRSRLGSSKSGSETDSVRHVCEVCKELLPDEQGLADHVEVAHTERQKPADHRPEGLAQSNSSSNSGGDEGLRSHMSSALGGLLTRALNNFLGKNRSQQSPPATQAQSPPASSPKPSQLQSMSKLLSGSLKTAGRRHSSGPDDQQPFNCMDCDVRFSSESNRNRHIARAHRNSQHRRLSTDSPVTESTVESSQNNQSVVNRVTETVTSDLQSAPREAAAEKPEVTKKSEMAHIEEPSTERRTRVKVDMVEKLDGLNEEDSIRAKAVAALRALNSKDRRTRNGFAGNNGPVLWTGVSRNKSRGNNSEERFRFPMVRKTPPSGNRFASLAEKKKKRITAGVVKPDAEGQAKENIEEVSDPTPVSLPSVPVSISYDVYEFQDEVEQVKPLGEYGLRGGVPGKTGGSDQQEEVPLQASFSAVMPAADNIEISNSLESGIKDTASKVPENLDEVSQSSEELVVKDAVASGTKSQHKVKKRFSKKKRWHRIIVDSGEETSDAEMLTESKRENRGIKRRHSVPSGVLVEDRQHTKKTKTKQPSRGSQKRSTKTDLLMSVFAKSRQRFNAASAARPTPLFSSSYKAYESESDSSSLAAGNLGVSSEDECRRPHLRKQKVSTL